jgi:methanogenic corrinoid protein MtbC1
VAVRRFDDELAFSVLNRAFARFAAGEVADAVVAPVLRRLGESWHTGPRMIAAEHFACQVVRARFQAHSAGSTPTGPLAVCFTPAGDQHDLGVHLAAAVLVDAGWRTRFLGADTPHASAGAAITELAPGLVVVGACMRPAAEDLLASGVVSGGPVLAGGAGFRSGDTEHLPDLVVHDGAFAAVPEAARRLVERVGATGCA